MSDHPHEHHDFGLKLRESSNILILAPSPHPMDINICTDLLAVRPPSEVNIWCLGITLAAEERIYHWYDRVGPLPDNFKIVNTRNPSISRETDPADEALPPSPEIITLDEPGNLTGIGVKFTDALTEWEDTPQRTMICIHSITPLIQYTEFTRVFQFLHRLKMEVEQTNALAHYHMDPAAHDAKTVGKIRQIFDTVVEVDSDDRWQVMTREFEAEGDGPIPTLDELDPGPLFED